MAIAAAISSRIGAETVPNFKVKRYSLWFLELIIELRPNNPNNQYFKTLLSPLTESEGRGQKQVLMISPHE
jgi:hypothetical protein